MRPSKAAVHSGLRQEQSAMAEGATLSGMPSSCRSTETTESKLQPQKLIHIYQ